MRKFSLTSGTSTARGRSNRWGRRLTAGATVAAGIALVAAGCASPGPTLHARSGGVQLHYYFKRGPSRAALRAGAQKIQHIVVITQENRSFDSLFGTFPGVHGIAAKKSKRPCLPAGKGRPCVRPFHTNYDISAGGPHGYRAVPVDVDNGKMDGFILAASKLHAHQCKTQPNAGVCNLVKAKQVMGYYDQREIPNYWRWAKRFVLADRYFESSDDWSFPSHLYEMSGWAGYCPDHTPMDCTETRNYHEEMFDSKLILAWTDITYLLHAYDVSWRYYVDVGRTPDCSNPESEACPLPKQYPSKGSIWNPLPQFDTVQQDGQLGNIQKLSSFYNAASGGALPAVSWIVPAQQHSEHSPARESDGQAFVTNIVDAIMKSPDWSSTAIFIQWDDWGGLYDNLRPPHIDGYGYGMRVPLIIVSPYAKAGSIIDQRLSSDAILKLIEDRFLRGARLNPRTDGRPDPRPDVRENERTLGNLLDAFNFRQTPIAPFQLPPHPHTDFREPKGYPKATQACSGECHQMAVSPLSTLSTPTGN